MGTGVVFVSDTYAYGSSVEKKAKKESPGHVVFLSQKYKQNEV